ncbi:MAG: 2-C-methyl-D-erythritol 4-phosphate cytidylyltransferase, partial [Burkholderiaceae bacterium]|nr:2-C-methyl-D-erythritol 4-phosphate cytidylyltransferase [Burkholderiaceae bacterium]
MPKTFAIVPAAGSGSRLGGDIPKQYLEIGGRSLLERSVAPLLAATWIDEVFVIVAPGDKRVPERLGADARLRILALGGATRRDTVLNAIRTIVGAEDDWVLVHDAARPGLDAAGLERMRAALANSAVGGLLALPVADTLKRARPGGGQPPAIAATIER